MFLSFPRMTPLPSDATLMLLTKRWVYVKTQRSRLQPALWKLGHVSNHSCAPSSNWNTVSGCISFRDNEAVVSGDVVVSASGSFPEIYIYIYWRLVPSPQPNSFSAGDQATPSQSSARQQWWKSKGLTHFAVIFNLTFLCTWAPRQCNDDEEAFDLSYRIVWGWQQNRCVSSLGL